MIINWNGIVWYFLVVSIVIFIPVMASVTDGGYSKEGEKIVDRILLSTLAVAFLCGLLLAGGIV